MLHRAAITTCKEETRPEEIVGDSAYALPLSFETDFIDDSQARSS